MLMGSDCGLCERVPGQRNGGSRGNGPAHENVATRGFLRCTSSILIEKHDATRQDAYI